MKLVKGEKNDSIVLLRLRFEEDEGVDEDVLPLPLVRSLRPRAGEREGEFDESGAGIFRFSDSWGITNPSSSFNTQSNFRRRVSSSIEDCDSSSSSSLMLMKLRGRARYFLWECPWDPRPSNAARAAERFLSRVLIVAVERVEGEAFNAKALGRGEGAGVIGTEGTEDGSRLFELGGDDVRKVFAWVGEVGEK